MSPIISGGGGGGGGSTPGAAVVHKFAFAFNTASLRTGVAAYTPKIGDVLLNAWIETTTAWDGTTPQADIGQYTAGDNAGYFSAGNLPIDLTVADQVIDASNGYLRNNHLNKNFDLVLGNTGSGVMRADAPGKFVIAQPVCVCVSQDGTPSGADPGATHGAAVLYLVTATPA